MPDIHDLRSRICVERREFERYIEDKTSTITAGQYMRMPSRTRSGASVRYDGIIIARWLGGGVCVV
jgi:hypothetical protein